MTGDSDANAGQDGSETPALRVTGLEVVLHTRRGAVHAVNGIDLDLFAGETHALVGESGSGKSVTALSIIGLLDPKRSAVRGSVWFGGRELLGLPEKQVRLLRGKDIALVPQDPSAALNPVRRVGGQVAESLRTHGESRAGAHAAVLKIFHELGLYAPEELVHRYPFELSGGMKQRVAIAAATMGEAKVVLADEPTTALDATIQQQVLALLDDLVRSKGAAMLLITHDLAVAGRVASRISVMYGGIIVERGTTEDVLRAPVHPYTLGLLGAIPRLRPPRGALSVIPGEAASPRAGDRGCPFRLRCSRALERCSDELPVLRPVSRHGDSSEGRVPHSAACWNPVGVGDVGVERPRDATNDPPAALPGVGEQRVSE